MFRPPGAPPERGARPADTTEGTIRLAIVNLAPDTAKTTTAVHLAGALARHGRTLLVDADPRRRAAELVALTGEDAVAARPLHSRNLHRRIDDLAYEFAHVVIDTPSGDPGVAASAVLAADRAIVPTTRAPADVAGLDETLRLLRQVDAIRPTRVSLLVNRVPPGAPRATTARRLLSCDADLLGARVPLLEAVGLATGLSGPASAYEPVADEILSDRPPDPPRALVALVADAPTPAQHR